MAYFKGFIELIYLMALLGLAIYGFSNAITVFIYWRTKKHAQQPTPIMDWPMVTIQLPIYNERYTVERLLKSVLALDYPKDKTQIQVLDDSTDDTSNLLKRLVKQYQEDGFQIEYLHRSNRQGFKAGALAEGLKTARGELIAIFDADFIPPQDWLKKTVIHFHNPRLACLQTRWGHTNADFNLFTRAQSLGIDGHFIVEQTARSRAGLFLNFNGTAGIWRRSAIEDGGGWQSDTLTEDLDLSYRVQLKGWQIGYLPDVVVPAELPVQIEAFKKQQFRWAKGSFQVVRKLFHQLMTTPMPETKRIMGLIHITGYFVHPLMLIAFLLILPIGLLSPHFLRMFPWTMVSAFGPPLLYVVSQTETNPRFVERVRLLPILILIGFGLSLNNTLAVFEGLTRKETGNFMRTPKFNVSAENKNWIQTRYVSQISRLVWVEFGLCLYGLLSMVILYHHLGWGSISWLSIYVASYSYIATMNLLQNYQTSRYKATQYSPV
ncbi:MAG: cellulose synthase family protein [Anaerolineales bacterium]